MKGISISLDASVAILILFISIMLAYAYFSSIQPYSPSNIFLRAYLQDAANAMASRGDFAAPLAYNSSAGTSGIAEVLASTPSSVCMQVEAYGIDIPDGIVAYWKLDENEGAQAAADISGRGHIGLAYGNVQFGRQSITGKSAEFDGATGYIESSVPELSGANAFTYSAWVNYKSVPGYSIILSRNGTWDGTLFLLQSGSSAKAAIQTNTIWVSGNKLLLPGEWHHIAATYDASRVRLYVDGELDGSYSYSSALSSQNPVRIGGQSSGRFNGSIADVRIYRRALNASEIAKIYSNPTGIIYAISKPNCPYAGGEIESAKIPFAAYYNQDENRFYYALVKAWARGIQ